MVGMLYSTSLPGLTRQSIHFQSRHSGMRPLGRRPGIQHRALFWIPGSREDARPGMTVYGMDARVKARA
jgi:hypothetical protein